MDRYFIFLYPDDKRLADLLNLAIYLLNPREKWPAHVTIAGPFNDPKKFEVRRDFNETVFALGSGNFFSTGSPTVFLRVDFLHRKEVWWKPDFKGNAIPHITLYDGTDIIFAKKLFDALRKKDIYFSFFTRRFEIVRSKSGQFTTTLREKVNMDCMNETRGMDIDNISLFSDEYRIDLAIRTLRKSHDYFL